MLTRLYIKSNYRRAELCTAAAVDIGDAGVVRPKVEKNIQGLRIAVGILVDMKVTSTTCSTFQCLSGY